LAASSRLVMEDWTKPIGSMVYVDIFFVFCCG